MHRDKKLGLALGILLVGIVAAFFFRNEPRPIADLPRLQDALALDEAIEEKPIAPYVTDGSAGEAQGADDPLAALEAHSAELNDPVASLVDDDWSFLQEGDADDPLAAAAPGPPAPIGYREATSSMASADPELNDLNAGWEIATGTAAGAAGERSADARRERSRNGRSAVSGTHSRGGTAFQQTSGRGTGITDRYSSPASNRSVAEEAQSRGKPSTGFAEASQTGSPGSAGSRETGRRTFRVKEYRVQSGDTLTGLSSRFLGTHKRYRELYEANRDRLKDVDDLRVGMLIRIPNAGGRSQTGLAQRTEPASAATAETVADTRGNSTAAGAPVESPRSASSNSADAERAIDDLLADSASENSRNAAPPSSDNPFAGSEPPPRESFTGSSAPGTAKPGKANSGTKSSSADAIAGTNSTGTGSTDTAASAGRKSPVTPIRPVSQGRVQAGSGTGTSARPATAGSTHSSSMEQPPGADAARPRTAAAGERTPENPYGLYLIEPAGDAPPATNDRRNSTAEPAAAPQRKFVPAGRLPGSRTRYSDQRPERDSRSSEVVPRTTRPSATSVNRPAEPRMWTVRRGDTLEGIAVKVYGRRSATAEIFEANRDRLKNPNLLRVGTKIRLPELSR